MSCMSSWKVTYSQYSWGATK